MAVCLTETSNGCNLIWARALWHHVDRLRLSQAHLVFNSISLNEGGGVTASPGAEKKMKNKKKKKKTKKKNKMKMKTKKKRSTRRRK